ncbi:unnamed protein product, partial [Symbiodinium microadriaticum]
VQDAAILGDGRGIQHFPLLRCPVDSPRSASHQLGDPSGQHALPHDRLRRPPAALPCLGSGPSLNRRLLT